jgi:hypothetical protein
MAVRLAPGVGDYATAFAALAEAVLDPIAVIGRDDEGMRFARPAAADLARANDETDEYRQGGGPTGEMAHRGAREWKVVNAVKRYAKRVLWRIDKFPVNAADASAQSRT